VLVVPAAIAATALVALSLRPVPRARGAAPCPRALTARAQPQA